MKNKILILAVAVVVIMSVFVVVNRVGREEPYTGTPVSQSQTGEKTDIKSTLKNEDDRLKSENNNYSTEKAEKTTSNKEPVAENTTDIMQAIEAKDDKSTFDIKTPYCKLKYPNKWKDYADVNVDNKEPCEVSFTAKSGKPIFKLFLGSEKGDLLGTIKTKKGNVVLRAEFSELDRADENYAIYSAMQNAVNVILQHLKKDYDFFEDAEEAEAKKDVFEISTPVVTLFYPQKWQDKVTVKTDDNKVRFSYGELKLFDVCFNTNEGSVIGTYKDTAVSFVSYDVSEKQLSPEEIDDITEMQADINVLINHLTETKGFELI